MAYTTVDKCSSFFNTHLHSGTGSSQSITGIGHQPDLVWVKSRTDTRKHNMYDSVRGTEKRIVTNSNVVEDTVGGVTAFNSDGFTLGTETDVNGSSRNFVSYNWKAGTTSGLSGGTITPSSYSINTSSKFGIYKYTGNGTSGATIAHGLGGTPACIWIKALSRQDDWVVGHHQFNGGTNAWNYIWKIRASSRSQSAHTAYWNDTAPTSSVFTLGNDTGVNNNGDTYVAYVWCEVPGFSAFREYRSSGYSDGPFLQLDFRPQFVIIGNRDTDDEIEMYDLDRAGYNDANYHLNQNLTTAEDTNTGRLDIVSNGIKLRTTNSGPINSGTAGQKYIIFAWGQSLVGSNNVPCTAR